ncbi:hypothetical protein OBV_02570 [Oscillibacter valericigenes Sjm18-20]|nr:hypothetical protein OBV_02570 [Oscillibacter valericigenes Sjm18-20]
MDKREETVRLWFDMWLKKENLGIKRVFSEDAAYIESWGPVYQGADKIQFWFEEWNSRGTVLSWDIRQFFHKGDQTVVEWYFKNAMNNGRTEAFDGVSLIRWTQGGQICFLKEFGCNPDRYDPYQNGPAPQFRDEAALWF